jgi:hypothetical protein
MPIKRIFWSGNTARDMHVLRGGSTPDLLHRLAFTKDDDDVDFADVYLINVADVDLRFMPLFKGAMNGDDFVGDGNGITVDTRTGVVSVDAAAPLHRKNNFIIEVTATNDSDGSEFHETIRVQVHGTVTQVWLTPDRLNVRPIGPPPERTNYRFAVRAQFDDGVVGDLTDGHDVTWAPASHVDTNGALVIDVGDNPGDNIFITATLPPALGGASTPLGPTLHIARPWRNEPSHPKVSIVAGGGLPGAVPPDNVPNILLLGDGFTAADEASFDTIVDTFVHHLKTNQLTRPFNLLSRSMNFWKTFIPAEQIGISFRSEMAITGIHPYARPLPEATKPKPGEAWEIEQLLYVVGLPVPGDEAPGRTPAVLEAEWAQLVSPDPAPNLTDDLVASWKGLARRAFIEEQDGFPGMSYGNPPAANMTDEYELDLHPERAGIDGLRAFYETLTSDDATLSGGRPVGLLWARKTFRFDNTDLVLLISSFPGGRAVNGTGYIALSTDASNAYIPVRPVAGKNAFTVDLGSVPADVSADRCRTVAHELGHSFGLGDEYAEKDESYPHDEDALAPDANVQTEADAQIPDPADPTKNILSGDEIKWNWHRIVAAAVVDGNITAAGADRFRIPVVPDVSFRFAPDDTVLLRPREWGTPLQKVSQTDLSPLLQVAEQPASAAVIVKASPGVAVTLADLEDFTPGSLLYIPKVAPASVKSAAYPFAEMVAKNVKDAITKNRMPLTVVPCVFDDDNTQVPILDGTGGRTPVAGIPAGFASMPRIVGLYAGGELYACGIFHPTGQCMMRHDHEEQAEFCAVCRYIMVDMIDPSMHTEIDLLYDKIYPQR